MKINDVKKGPRAHHVILFYLFVLVSLFIILIGNPLNADNLKTRSDVVDNEEHDVGVSAQLVPFYAEDADGKPVFDLKREEIRFFVDDKEHPLMSLSRFRFDSTETIRRESKTGKPAPQKPVKRYNVILIDYMFNSAYGLVRTARICKEIIKNSAADESFIIMESISEHGLDYIAGPTSDRVQLTKALEKVKERGMTSIRAQNMRLRNYGGGAFYRSQGTTLAAGAGRARLDLHAMEQGKSTLERRFTLKVRAMKFASSITQIHDALSAIRRPKIVYLFSQGVPPGTVINEYNEGREHYKNILKKSAKTINRNGGLLYVIDSSFKRPGMKVHYSGETSLRALADGGNGKYFSGNSIKELAGQVKKSTSAYYELAFTPIKRKRFNIRIQSTRPGIRILTISQTEKAPHYSRMKKMRKKLFALNVVTGGDWSRTEGTVKLQSFTKKPGPTGQTVGFTIDLPDAIRNRPVDVYTINIDPRTKKADFKIEHLKGQDRLMLQGTRMTERWLYFVIIEPQTATCLFNRVI